MIEGPETVNVGDESVYSDAPGAVRTHGHAFFLDGELMAFPSTHRRVNWTFDEPGIYEVTVRMTEKTPVIRVCLSKYSSSSSNEKPSGSPGGLRGTSCQMRSRKGIQLIS